MHLLQLQLQLDITCQAGVSLLCSPPSHDSMRLLCVPCVLCLQGTNGGQKYNVLIDVPFKTFSDAFRE